MLIVPGNEARQQQAKWLVGVNGEQVFADAEDRTVYLRDVEGGEDVALFKGHEENVTSAQFNADGSQVVTAGEDGTVRVWNSGDRRQYGTMLPGHSSAVAEAAFSPDGRYVMTTFGLRHEALGATGGERSVRIWNKDTGTLLHTLKEDLGLHKRPAKGNLLEMMRGLPFLEVLGTPRKTQWLRIKSWRRAARGVQSGRQSSAHRLRGQFCSPRR